MEDVQCWVASGTITKEAALKFTAGGFPICDFEMHSHRTYTVKGTAREENLTASCTILGDLGKQMAPSLKAGVRVLVRGRWKLSEWVDAKTQQPRKRHVVTVDECEILSVAAAPSPDAIIDDQGSPF